MGEILRDYKLDLNKIDENQDEIKKTTNEV